MSVNIHKDFPVVILCGGLGTRLKNAFPETPKALVPIADRPFLDYVLDFFLKLNFKKFILCIGYKGQAITSYYQNSPYELAFSQETRPLGTGGALRHARQHVNSKTFLVVNGDSFCALEIMSMLDFHKKHRDILVTVAATSSHEQYDAEGIELDEYSHILSFSKRDMKNKHTLINAGVYIMNREIFTHIPDQQSVSLEYDVFPHLPYACRYGFVTKKPVFDIGTPDRIISFEEYVKKM